MPNLDSIYTTRIFLSILSNQRPSKDQVTPVTPFSFDQGQQICHSLHKVVLFQLNETFCKLRLHSSIRLFLDKYSLRWLATAFSIIVDTKLKLDKDPKSCNTSRLSAAFSIAVPQVLFSLSQEECNWIEKI